jgi:hypothetical protein
MKKLFWLVPFFYLPSTSSFSVGSDYYRAMAVRSAVSQDINGLELDETIKLPTSKGFNQLGTGLCWSYSTLNVLESSWLARNPNITVELSRRAMQYFTMEDRFMRYIYGTHEYLAETGTAIDAIELIRKNGLIAFADFKDVADPYGHTDVKNAVDRETNCASKLTVLHESLSERYSVPPENTHLGDFQLKASELGSKVTRNETWVSFAASDDGTSGWRHHPDPDARLDTKSYFIPRGELHNKIKSALNKKYAVEVSIGGHSIMLYGASYDKQGNPTNYFMKDSYPDYFYNANPEKLLKDILEISIPNSEE